MILIIVCMWILDFLIIVGINILPIGYSLLAIIPCQVPGAYAMAPPAQMSEEQQRNAMLMQQAQMAGSIPSDPPKAVHRE